jgi:hypothetical protein
MKHISMIHLKTLEHISQSNDIRKIHIENIHYNKMHPCLVYVFIGF